MIFLATEKGLDKAGKTRAEEGDHLEATAEGT